MYSTQPRPIRSATRARGYDRGESFGPKQVEFSHHSLSSAILSSWQFQHAEMARRRQNKKKEGKCASIIGSRGQPAPMLTILLTIVLSFSSCLLILGPGSSAVLFLIITIFSRCFRGFQDPCEAFYLVRYGQLQRQLRFCRFYRNCDGMGNARNTASFKYLQQVPGSGSLRSRCHGTEP